MRITLIFASILLSIACKGSATVQVNTKNSSETSVPGGGSLYSVIHDEHEYIVFGYQGGILHSPKCACNLTITKEE